jgi:hypothetical protein
MADTTPTPGRLIAVDASRGRDVAAEAETIATRLRARGVPCGISRWDASGLFGELLTADADELIVAPRTLTLLYAADLMFRLKWEIRPALAAGQVVIAAPYVATAVAVGVGIGLPEAWMREVLRIAEAPDTRIYARERKPAQGWKTKPGRGYGEFCATLLDNAPAGLARRKARARSMTWLASEANAGGSPRGRKALQALARRYGQTPAAGD